MAPSRRARGAATAPFPSGTYDKYKRATSFFLHWLLRARHAGLAGSHGAAKAAKQSLDVYDRIVKAIAAEPTALPPALLQLYTRALEACESAITLRERVALFLADDADDGHAHFLDRLKDWFATLKRAYTPAPPSSFSSSPSTKPSTGASEETKTLDFSNYYDVLSLPDDYFEAVESPALEAASRATPLSAAERRKLFDQAFAQDVGMELMCLLLELDELSEAVYSAFYDVKCQRKTLLEAAAVAKIAIDSAASVAARLQLRFPAVGDAIDLMVMIADYIPEKAWRVLTASVIAAWMPIDRLRGMTDGEGSQDSDDDDEEVDGDDLAALLGVDDEDEDDKDEGDDSDLDEDGPEYQYVTGTIVLDFIWMTKGLRKMANTIGFNPDGIIAMEDGLYGETYNEERTQHYVVPDLKATQSFLVQQLPLLFNKMLEYRHTGVEIDPGSFRGWYFGLFEKYFRTQKVSIQVVFVCICWLRSVAALQGDAGLGRNISVSVLHHWKLMDRLSSVTSNRADHDEQFKKQIDVVLSSMQAAEDVNLIVRANPILAGINLLDDQISYLHLGAEAIQQTTRFRAFCHLYSALCDRKLLEPIRFIEDTISSYESRLFKETRAAASHGAYTREYLRSFNLTDSTINAILNLREMPQDRRSVRGQSSFQLREMSRLVKVVLIGDYSVLPNNLSKTSSWSLLLTGIEDLCNSELFDSCVLSRDMLKLDEDLGEVFHSLCVALDRKQTWESFMTSVGPRVPQHYARTRTLVESVMLPLLPLLDSLNLDGSFRFTSEAADALRLERSRPNLMARFQRIADENRDDILAYCQDAAHVISAYFGGERAASLEELYYTFPSTPNWVDQEFGRAVSPDKGNADSTSKTFATLLSMLETSDGPLQGDNLKKFKDLVTEDPAVLGVVVPGPDTELCTLLHHAAAGRARDRRLVEWLVQMGALKLQPKHFHNPTALEKEVREVPYDSQLCDTLAVHSAAKAGLVDMMQYLLEANHRVDLNVITYHTKQSLAHIAVKRNDRAMYELLTDMGIRQGSKKIIQLQ